ncbi:uncharacterized protein G2W53_040980 [Senna tora]|uniref:Uncharacterized protein n=1 Tax=Senna tora TaxID=362788 RepID=A0A834SR61_9FABA|nr:uncharacterized protein G2W53_040980 [Senna tora]
MDIGSHDTRVTTYGIQVTTEVDFPTNMNKNKKEKEKYNVPGFKDHSKQQQHGKHKKCGPRVVTHQHGGRNPKLDNSEHIE